MGRKAKTQRAIKRAAEKRARKESMQRQYEQWAADGKNSKSKRARIRARQEERVGIRVKNPKARNIGDSSAFPEVNVPFMVRTYLLERDMGFSRQYSGKHRGTIRDLCKAHNLHMKNGVIFSGDFPAGDSYLRTKVAESFRMML
jgi:hypothetical protein